MAGAVKVGYWGAAVGDPKDINDCSKPQRLESITICSSEHPNGGRIYGFSFVYVDQQGKSIQSSTWGNTYPGFVKKIKMSPGEHLNYVSGTADRSGLTSLKLATNQSEYGPYGYPEGSNSFSVPLQQGKGEVVAFFGRSGDSLKALGIYVPGKKSSPVKVGPWGGHGGRPGDIRLSNKPDQLQSVTISSTQAGGGRIHSFSFAYVDQNGVPIRVGPWGKNKGRPKTFSMSPGEYVNSISGTTDSYGVTSIKFSTNFNKEGYGPYGCSSGTAFSVPLPDNGTNDGQDNGAAVAFFGRSGDTLIAIGVYVGLAPKSDAESEEDDD